MGSSYRDLKANLKLLNIFSYANTVSIKFYVGRNYTFRSKVTFAVNVNHLFVCKNKIVSILI